MTPSVGGADVAPAAPAAGPRAAPSSSSPSEAARAEAALKPWIEVALPHPDVIANRFKEAEFAADLFAVDAGHATEGYATPADFFRITFLTEGLKRVLVSALQRLAGTGGDPVIGLQTTFGGGKTHTMLAIYHLARHLADGGDPRALAGMAGLMDRAGVATLPSAEGRGLRRLRRGRRRLADPEGRAAGPHALGLHRLAARRRGRPRARGRGRGGAHQPRLGAAGRAVQARRAERHPARRARRLRPPAPRRPLRGASCPSSSR